MYIFVCALSKLQISWFHQWASNTRSFHSFQCPPCFCPLPEGGNRLWAEWSNVKWRRGNVLILFSDRFNFIVTCEWYILLVFICMWIPCVEDQMNEFCILVHVFWLNIFITLSGKIWFACSFAYWFIMHLSIPYYKNIYITILWYIFRVSVFCRLNTYTHMKSLVENAQYNKKENQLIKLKNKNNILGVDRYIISKNVNEMMQSAWCIRFSSIFGVKTSINPKNISMVPYRFISAF